MHLTGILCTDISAFLRAQEDDTQHTMDDWAPDAHLEFRGVSAAYGIGLDPVLKSISFCLEV